MFARALLSSPDRCRPPQPGWKGRSSLSDRQCLPPGCEAVPPNGQLCVQGREPGYKLRQFLLENREVCWACGHIHCILPRLRHAFSGRCAAARWPATPRSGCASTADSARSSQTRTGTISGRMPNVAPARLLAFLTRRWTRRYGLARRPAWRRVPRELE